MTGQKPLRVVFQADDTLLPFHFWDNEDKAIGDYESFYIDNIEYSLSSLIGLEDWLQI